MLAVYPTHVKDSCRQALTPVSMAKMMEHTAGLLMHPSEPRVYTIRFIPVEYAIASMFAQLPEARM